MMSLCARAVLFCFAFSFPGISSELNTDASAAVVSGVKAWLKLPRDKRPAIPNATAETALSKADAAELSRLLWGDHVAEVKATRAGEVEAKLLTHGELKMKYEVVSFGEKKPGQPLFISMHGGGNAPAHVNESQWRNQIKLGREYNPKAGFYVAPRAPTDTWNLWHQGHIDALFDRLIQNMIAFEGVDANRVYIMGYSAGGDGVYQLAPRMADRLAAAAMMAGHPNDASPLGLRNIGFTIHVGENDGGYGRNEAAGKWGKQLDDLQKADPKGYAHFVHVHEGRGHWMNMEDREAIPWMEKFTRNPLPEKVVWHQSGRVHERFYWLSVPKAEAKPGQHIIAERSGQNITVTATSNPHVTILLNDAMLDLDQPVTVTFNGTALPPCSATRTLAVIRRTLHERGDPHLTFSAEITVP
jgi:predicted esterase